MSYSDDLTEKFVRQYWRDDPARPKHERLRQAFYQSILDGFWSPGARLPTESDLVRATPCSLGTIQRSLRDLASDGIIERRRGSGSVVAGAGRTIDKPWHMRFTDPNRPEAGFLPVYTRTIRRNLSPSDGAWSDILNSRKQPHLRIERVFRIGEVLRVYSIFRARAGRFETLETLPLAELDGANLKHLISHELHLRVQSITHRLRVEKPPRMACSQADCIADQPTAVLNAVAADMNGEALYYQDFYIPESHLTLALDGFTSPR
ncbi:MAG: GntR family transcriptional regulator [Rhodospirillales bacterium]